MTNKEFDKELLRLLAWGGRERAMFARLYKEASGASKERAYGEVNVCDSFISRIRKLREKLKAEPKTWPGHTGEAG